MCLETSLKPQTEINICIVVIPFVFKYYIVFGVFFLMFSNIMATLPLAEESGCLQNR